MTSEHTEKPKDDKSACQDTEANWQPSDSDADGVVTVDIEGLRRPEEQDGEKVGSRYKGDDECQDENTWVLL